MFNVFRPDCFRTAVGTGGCETSVLVDVLFGDLEVPMIAAWLKSRV